MFFVRYMYFLMALITAQEPSNAVGSSTNDNEKLKGHMQPFGSSGPYFQLFEIEGFPASPRDFFNKYVIPSTPLLMKNAAKYFPAFTKWTDTYFLNHPGSEEEWIFAEGGKKEDRNKEGKSMTFKKFVEKYNTTDMYMVSSLPTHIRTDITIPPPLQCEPVLESFHEVITWFSSGGTKSVLHNDFLDNVNCLFRGNKTLIFINPHDDIELQRNLLDNVRGMYSTMDVEAVDYNKFPALVNLRYARVDMYPGDCLYIPYRWMHQVNSFGSNLAVNFWWHHRTKDFFDLDEENCGQFTGRDTVADIPNLAPEATGEPKQIQDKDNILNTIKEEVNKELRNMIEEIRKERNILDGAEFGIKNLTNAEKQKINDNLKSLGKQLREKIQGEEPGRIKKEEEDQQIEKQSDYEDQSPYTSQNQMTDKIYNKVLKERQPIDLDKLEELVRESDPDMFWNEKCREILYRYYELLDKDKDDSITSADAVIYYNYDEEARARDIEKTWEIEQAFLDETFIGTIRKERKLVQILIDRGEIDQNQISTIFGKDLKIKSSRDHTKDEL